MGSWVGKRCKLKTIIVIYQKHVEEQSQYLLLHLACLVKWEQCICLCAHKVCVDKKLQVFM